MADYVVQTIRAGQAGVIAWALDDAMHVHAVGYGKKRLKGWGFWNSLGGRYGYPKSDAALRPWYDVWSMLSRALPRGSTTVAVSAPVGTRATAALIPDGGLSIALVNTDGVARTLRLVVPNGGNATLEEYRYFENDQLRDAAGFPTARRVHKNVDLKTGLPIALPGRGLVTLSSRRGL
jgi:hypothetical protein